MRITSEIQYALNATETVSMMENNNEKEGRDKQSQPWLSMAQKNRLRNEAKEMVIDELLDPCYVSSVGCLKINEVQNHYDASSLNFCYFSKVDRCSKTGAPLGILEPMPDSPYSYSTSAMADGISGNSQSLSFVPGGMEEEIAERISKRNIESAADEKGEYLTCAPGLADGIHFDSSETELSSDEEAEEEVDDEELQSDEQVVSLDEHLEETAGPGNAELDAIIPTETDNPLHDNELGSDQAYCHASRVGIKSTLQNFERLRPRMAKTFPFELDLFQKQAILCLEAGQSVFVAAHTSAGKTAVADYAVALCYKNMTRAIYTSPIKALSNQKYRDFKQDYNDVGIVTGDIQLNQDSFCVVMTTEILRSILYNGSEVLRELEWVIFDEVHYVNNPERGVVWEEVIIMLPAHVKLILLSATVSDVMEFADWIGRIKGRKIYVVSTDERPVPLEHHLYLGDIGRTKNVQIPIVDRSGTFLIENFHNAVRQKENSKAAKNYKNFYTPYNGNGTKEKNLWLSLIQHLKEKSLLPMVVFVFSRKVCDTLSVMLMHTTTLDLTTASEKNFIRRFFNRCISNLNRTDRTLRQVKQLQLMCERGIAVHHSGVLPLMKEIVEMLFQEGRVRVLFATETFSMGINMPAKTVVFNSMDKHDGRTARLLNPGEYTQMAGRAGRRGLDSIGTVILLCRDRVPNMSDLRTMILGTSPRMESQFRVTYTMILNLLRYQPLSPEMMFGRSFVENMSYHGIRLLNKRIEALSIENNQAQFSSCVLCQEGNIKKFYRVAEECYDVARCMFANVSKIIEPGMVIVVQLLEKWLIGLVLKKHFYRNDCLFEVFLPYRNLKPKNDKLSSSEKFNQFLLYSTRLECNILEPDFRYYSLIEFPLSNVVLSCNMSLPFRCHQIFDDWGRSQNKHKECEDDYILYLIKRLYKIYEYYMRNPTEMHSPLPWCSLKNVQLDIAYLKRLQEGALKFRCLDCARFKEHFSELCRLEEKQAEVEELRRKLKCFQLRLLPSYEKKRNVLLSLKYINHDNMIQFPGRVACSINQNPLLYSQLLLNNKFADLTPDEVAAILSASACQYKCKVVDFSEPRLTGLMKIVCDMDKRIHQIREKCGDVDDDIDEQLNFGLMEVIQKWSLGVPFDELLKITDAQEGAIVRCIQRVCELCRDLRTASLLMGNSSLTTLIDNTLNSLKRDIVFAASLYLAE
ncbi:Helicase SKI2W [Trichinella pseudospiralis]|uniref:Helicase SKI2W n=1 Tax=Trichinella pseudospiralis TaxID=6337 RepID=A0A0V1E3I8_TRIPS|nr:Helicase SKI2W [Trichinella pseudospiralis]